MQIIPPIQNRIYETRSQRVTVDSGLAAVYETDSKILNHSVKRNSKRLPEDLMFQLSPKVGDNPWARLVTSGLRLIDPKEDGAPAGTTISALQHGGSRYLPCAFTKQGVAIFSSILNSGHAIETNSKVQLKKSKERVCNHDGLS